MTSIIVFNNHNDPSKSNLDAFLCEEIKAKRWEIVLDYVEKYLSKTPCEIRDKNHFIKYETKKLQKKAPIKFKGNHFKKYNDLLTNDEKIKIYTEYMWETMKIGYLNCSAKLTEINKNDAINFERYGKEIEYFRYKIIKYLQ